MKHINLQNPILRNLELDYTEFDYPIISRKFLPEPVLKSDISLSDILNKRTSKRTFGLITLEQINFLLWHCARTLKSNTTGNRWEHRPVPSAGGKHPVDIFIIRSNKEKVTVSLYENKSHSLAELNIDEKKAEDLVNEAQTILPRQDAAIFWFGAQFSRTVSRYKNGESLVWRDTGILIGTFALIAESINLNCCSLGITGEPHFSGLFKTEQLAGVGGIYVGSK